MARRFRIWGAGLVALCALTSVGAGTVGAQGGTVTGDKTVTPGDIQCDGSVQVTVSLEAQTGLAGDPEDIMLVLDRSGSMGGQPIADLITAANTFVDIIDQATDGTLDGTIANGSRVGVVSFNQAPTLDVALTDDAGALHTAINALVAGGTTNHADSIELAQAQLAGSEPDNTKQMIIMTDGQSNVGGDGQAEALAARTAGTEIFVVGLGGVNTAQLNGWATDPDDQHVFIAPSSAELEDIFEAIGAAIVVPAATNVAVLDTVDGHFSVSNPAVSKGTVMQADNQLLWEIDELGTETVTLTYTATHDPTQPGGVEQVNDSVDYTDDENLVVTFPNPSVNVRGCPATIELTPPTATNELVPGADHTVTATVEDDFGDPVNGVDVAFEILSGPNAGKTGSGTTAGAGETTFTYAANQGLAGLGTDTIEACFTNGQGQEVCDTATKEWVDTTPPDVACSPTNNPSGDNVPPAGDNPKSGQNPDGFYVLTATDLVDPDPDIFLADSASSAVFGPFASGTKIKLTQSPGGQPSIKEGAGDIDWKIHINGDALVTGTDASGNTSAPVSCRVPPPPK
jgi:uncharacterized protein YegL